MQQNTKYFTAEKIFSRLQRVFRQKMQEYAIGDVVEVCAEIELEILGNYNTFRHVDKHALVVNQSRVMLPCDLYRLKDVYTGGNQRIFFFTNNGTYLSFNEECNILPSDGSTIYINYEGIPVDENGYPMLLRGHEQACFWGCVVRFFEEDHAMGRVNENTWRDWSSKYEFALSSANTGFRHMSRNEMKTFLAVMYDAIPKVSEMNLKTLG
jgi:hypothetical protein